MRLHARTRGGVKPCKHVRKAKRAALRRERKALWIANRVMIGCTTFPCAKEARNYISDDGIWCDEHTPQRFYDMQTRCLTPEET